MTKDEAQMIAEVEGAPFCCATGREHRWGPPIRRDGGEKARRCLDCEVEAYATPYRHETFHGRQPGEQRAWDQDAE